MAHKLPKAVKILLVSAFWLGVWQLVFVLTGSSFLLPSPAQTLSALWTLLGQSDFWARIFNTFWRIAAGFLSAAAVGVLFAALSASFSLLHTLIAPLAQTVKATPVVSFIIVALIWIKSANLSIFISFLMVFPIIYINTLSGIESADKQLLEAARVFGTKQRFKMRYIYLPAALPQFAAGASAALGLCWKSGVAAEVIGLPAGTIGEQLYEAKLYLNTPELFAYTVVIIIISVAFEKLFSLVIRRAFPEEANT